MRKLIKQALEKPIPGMTEEIEDIIAQIKVVRTQLNLITEELENIRNILKG